MTTWTGAVHDKRSWVHDKLFLGMTFKEYLLSLATPFNFIALIILCIGLPITWIRFTQGIGPVTNLTHDYPWGLWIGFDVLCGVALAAGGYCIASAVHIFGLKQYRHLDRFPGLFLCGNRSVFRSRASLEIALSDSALIRSHFGYVLSWLACVSIPYGPIPGVLPGHLRVA
jgi:hypothetical protein